MSRVESLKRGRGRQRVGRRAFLKGVAGAAGLVAAAACSAPPSPTAVEKEVTRVVTREVPLPTPAEKREPVNIRYSSVKWGGVESKLWMDLISRFHESQSAVRIPKGYEDVTEGYAKVMTQAAGGVAADVYLFETKYMQSFASLGFFPPLDDYVAKSPVVNKEKYFATDWQEMFWGGKQRLVPFDNSPAMIWYNTEMFDAAGVAYPPDKFGQWKWQDFLQTAKTLTQGSGMSRVFGWIGEQGWVYFLPWVWSNGGWLLNEKKTECVIDMPETVEALQWAADLIHVHKVCPLAAELMQGGTKAMFLNRRGAMSTKGTYWVIELKAQEGLKWNVAPYPDGRAGSFTRNPLDAWGIWNGSHYKDAAWQFIEFLSSDESLAQLTLAGLSVSNKKIMSEVFPKQEPKNVHWHLFADALSSHVKRHPDTAIYMQMNDLIKPEWDAVLAGKKTVKEMVQALKGPINSLLAKCIKAGECEG